MKVTNRAPILALAISLVGSVSAQTPASAPAQREAASANEGRVTTTPNCRPSYPEDALRAGAQGISNVRLYLDDLGWVTKVEILHGSGPTPEHHSLDAAAASALMRCQFKPAHDAAGLPKPSHVDIEYRWVLQ